MTCDVGMYIEQMEEDILSTELENRATEVHKETGWDEFWLVFSMKPDKFLCNIIRQSWAAINIRPNPISNTIQFYVNWKQGRIETRVYPPSSDPMITDLYDIPLLPGEKLLDYSRQIG